MISNVLTQKDPSPTTKVRSSEAVVQITSAEWRFVLLVTLAILVITSLPYIYGYLSAPPGRQFMGLMQDVPDHGQYLSWWRSFQSALLVPNKLTPEPNRPLFFNLLWWLLAQVSKFTGLGYASVYQILRWGGGIALLVAVYRLLALIFDDLARRRLAFLLIALSSGFGWILVIMKYVLGQADVFYPLLTYNAESNYFLCLLGFPHFALAAALICLVFEFALRGLRSSRMRDYLIAGGWAFLLGWMHAYDMLILYGVLGSFALGLWLTRRRFPISLFWGTLIIALLSCWAAVYSFLLTSLDPLWKQVLAQFPNAGIYTPNPLLLFFLLGLPLFLAVAGLVAWIRQKEWTDTRLFVTTWLGMGFLLLYIPTDFQIHMLNSWQIPVMILATDVVTCRYVPRMARLRPTLARWLPALMLLLVLPTNLYLWSWRFIELARHDYPYYLETDYIRATDWLRENTPPEAVVLSSLTVGQYIPALSGNSAFLAHWANTVNFYDKQARVEQFYNGATSQQRIDTVRTFQVEYVMYGPAERALGSPPLDKASWLESVFSSPQVTVYRVLAEKFSSVRRVP